MPNSKRQAVARRTLDIIPLVMRVMSAEMRQAHHGVQPGHIGLLGILRIRPYTLGELADKMCVSAPTMSNTINALEERGWVERTRSDEDRRIVWITIADAGRQFVETMNADTEARITELLDGLDDDQCEAMLSGLTLLRDVFAAALERDPLLNKG